MYITVYNEGDYKVVGWFSVGLHGIPSPEILSFFSLLKYLKEILYSPQPLLNVRLCNNLP